MDLRNIPLSKSHFIAAYQDSRDTFMWAFEYDLMDNKYKDYLNDYESYHKNCWWIIDFMK